MFVRLSRRVTATSTWRCPERTCSGCCSRKVSQTTSAQRTPYDAAQHRQPCHFDFAGFLQDQDDTVRQDEEMNPGETPDLPRYGLQCQWAPLSGLDPDTLTFPGGAPMQLHTVPPGLVPRISHFYVCTRCGKVFWEGSHFDRVLAMFQEVLHITDTEPAAVTTARRN